MADEDCGGKGLQAFAVGRLCRPDALLYCTSGTPSKSGPRSSLSNADWTVMPSSGRMMSPSERARHAQHMLGHVRQDQVGRDRRHLVQPRLAELALHIVFMRKAKPAMELQAGVGRFP